MIVLERQTTEYHERIVANGVALLDSRVPDWYQVIDTETLDISSSRDCVVGQLYGRYSYGIEELGVIGGDNYGFAGPVEKLWIREINKRRAANLKPVKEPKYHWFAGLRHAVASLF